MTCQELPPGKKLLMEIASRLVAMNMFLSEDFAITMKNHAMSLHVMEMCIEMMKVMDSAESMKASAGNPIVQIQFMKTEAVTDMKDNAKNWSARQRSFRVNIVGCTPMHAGNLTAKTLP
jgi:hypothetical protein